jgi:PAS domain S-box-containing protein
VPGARFRSPPAGAYDLIAAAYLLLDSTGVIREVNRSASELVGRREQALIGMPLRNIVAEPDRANVLEHIRRCRAGIDVIETELRLLAMDGGLVPVRLYGRRVQHEGAVVFPTVAIDLTEQLQNERALEAAQRQRDIANQEREIARAAEAAKDRLIAVVSHELRNPLSPALIAAEGLASWPGLPEQARHLAMVIRRNIELEARLIDDLLDVARISRGQLRVRLEPTDIHDVLVDAVAATQSTADEKLVTITLEALATEHSVYGDAGRLRQVFWNLINNAVKFSDANGSVQVTTRNAGGHLHVSVRDHGIGMDSSTLAELFRTFTPGGGGHRGGLGLGLSIAKEIVVAHGGTIEATSDGPGRGSTFDVTLGVLGRRERGTPDAERRRHVASRPLPRAGRVLIAENDRDAGGMLAMFLRERGYEPTVVPSLVEALQALDRGWDVVLADIGLGDGSGLEIARAAKRLPRPPARLIACSGYGSVDDVRASRAAGFDAHLVKPIDLTGLLRALAARRPIARRRDAS